MDAWLEILIIAGAIAMSVATVVVMTLPTRLVHGWLRALVLIVFGIACVGVHMLPGLNPYFSRWILFVAFPGAMTYLILRLGWNRAHRRARATAK